MRRVSLLIVLSLLASGPASAQVSPLAPKTPPVSSGDSSDRTTSLQFDASYEHLSNGYAPWRSMGLTMWTSTASRQGFHAGVRQSVRFARLDHEIIGGVRHRLTSALTGAADFDVSPSHHVAPRWSLLGRLEVDAGGGWTAQASVQHRRYDSATVGLASLTAERYVSRYRGAYTMSVARLGTDDTAFTHRAAFDVYYGQRPNSLGISVSAGDELEHVQPLGVLRTSVRSLAVIGRQGLTRHWFLTYDAVVQEQGSLYVRRRMGINLGYRL